MLVIILVVGFLAVSGQSNGVPKKKEKTMDNKHSAIYLAGGCFWGTEHFLKQIQGVVSTEVGYANGHTKNPSYEEVCTGKTGFAETVKILYDPSQVALQTILELYFLTIDPTSLNRQGGDRGEQYRTGIYYTSAKDVDIIKASLKTLEGKYTEPLVIEVKPLSNFYVAEDYHQAYLEKNKNGYCHISPELFAVAKNAHKVPSKDKNNYSKPDEQTLR